MPTKPHICTAVLTASFLAGCTAVGPDYRPATAGELGVPAAYQQASPLAAGPEQIADWWRTFGDADLDRVVGLSLAGNLDLAQSLARLRQAREALVQARGAQLPNLSASAGANEFIAEPGGSRSSLSLGSSASWEADIFGGLRRTSEAARADAEASYFDMAGVRVAVAAETASNYIMLRQAQEQLLLARDTLRIADDNLQIARWRVQAGLVSSLDEEQARASRAQTSATIPSIEARLASASYRLAILTGEAPGAASYLVEEPGTIPRAPEGLAVGIPADTLRQRPDVRSAERSLAAATARIGVAEARLYPALRIGGDLSTSAATPGGLFDLVTGNFFGTLGQLIFDGGRSRAQLRASEAAAEGALAAYRKAVLVAIEDTENGLAATAAGKAREQAFEVALEAASNSAILARSQYRSGLTDFRTLLDAERALLAAREGLLGARAERAQAAVQLYRALGGGWNAAVSLPNPEGS